MKGHILIVEDDATLRKHLARLFAREGYTVDTAACRAAAAEQLAQASFDVLLLDLQLPDGNGLDLLAELAVERRPARAVLMTAFSGDDSEQRAQRLNVRRLLRKPLDLLQLLDAVHGTRASETSPA